MSVEIIGGKRLGSGGKMKTDQPHYNRSTHDLSYIWKNTQAPGTLVPFMVEVGLPGSTFDIDLDNNTLTHPTNGPLFGSFKSQSDVVVIPVRLYQAELMMNKLEIGNSVKDLDLPLINIVSDHFDPSTDTDIDNHQINPSCLYKYMGISGIGQRVSNDQETQHQHAEHMIQ